VKSILVLLALLTGVSAYAATAWEHHSSGDGTAFEERWVTTNAIESLSSNETLASNMFMGAALNDGGGLYIWVAHPSLELCKFSDWRLAVDQAEISIEPKLSDGEDATVLTPMDEGESADLRRLFRNGQKIAVNVYANCDNMFFLQIKNTVTMTYSLSGSEEALKFVTGAATN
jgi:hypothetical protein